MSRPMRQVLSVVAGAAWFVALQPYFRFIAGPPPGQERRWFFTVVALGVAFALTAYLLRTSTRFRGGRPPRDR